jgi:hypothetical protein
MKIFNGDNSWVNKVNFVDENNVVLGWDMSSQCCEQYGWFFNDTIVQSENMDGDIDCNHNEPDDIENWRFDPSFRAGDGESQVFRVFHIDPTISCKYLHIFNFHNGYYSHGFDWTVNGKTEEGSL